MVKPYIMCIPYFHSKWNVIYIFLNTASSAKSKGKKGSARKGKTPTPEPEPEPEERPGTPPPQPGTDEWVYVDEPIEEVGRVRVSAQER